MDIVENKVNFKIPKTTVFFFFEIKNYLSAFQVLVSRKFLQPILISRMRVKKSSPNFLQSFFELDNFCEERLPFPSFLPSFS